MKLRHLQYEIDKRSRYREKSERGCDCVEAVTPLIFNIYIQDALHKIREVVDVRGKVQGEQTNVILFCDYVLVVTKGQQDPRDILKQTEGKTDWNINTEKAVEMVCDGEETLKSESCNEGETLHNVEKFTFPEEKSK